MLIGWFDKRDEVMGNHKESYFSSPTLQTVNRAMISTIIEVC